MPRPTKIRLLYAEDDPDTRDMICLALEREGFEVICPDSPREFLQKAKDEQWDVYMLDTWMPDISGFDLCKKLREFDSETPILFYSAAAYDRDKKRAFECGAEAYIVKPVPLEILIKGITSAVESHQANGGQPRKASATS